GSGGNREHSIQDHLAALNVVLMERLRSSGRFECGVNGALTKGATASAQLYSLVEIAKANGQEPYAWLRHALERLPTATSVEDYEALLPWNFSPASLS
ncbi:transposase domain-containing protein, partial [Pseudomonas alliivorans]|nr:transposase domain-containing protein [Pseudomonas alliivorans]